MQKELEFAHFAEEKKKIIFFLLTNITGELTRVYKVATKGEQQGDRWVTSYYLTLSEDGETFFDYKAAQAGFTVNSLLYTGTKHTAFHNLSIHST